MHDSATHEIKLFLLAVMLIAAPRLVVPAAFIFSGFYALSNGGNHPNVEPLLQQVKDLAWLGNIVTVAGFVVLVWLLWVIVQDSRDNLS